MLKEMSMSLNIVDQKEIDLNESDINFLTNKSLNSEQKKDDAKIQDLEKMKYPFF